MTGELAWRDAEQGDLRMMLREVVRPHGTKRLLRWLARRVDGSVVLLGRAGQPWEGHPGPPAWLLTEAADVLGSVVDQRRQSAASDVGGYSVRALAIDTHVTLVVARQGGLSSKAGTTIADAAKLLRMQWRVEQADRRRREVALAESFVREATLRLIMAGNVDGARRAAGALQQKLPDPLRVYLIARDVGGRGDLDEPARLCAEASGGSAWIAPCPVYPHHLAVLASAEPDETSLRLDEALRRLAATRTDLRIGVGQTVTLRHTLLGYEQAFHALAAAGTSPARFAVFPAHSELVTLIGAEGRGWAGHVLSPLVEFVPTRGQDPDADALISTLRSWLNLHGRAAGQLRIHRNTLTARMQRIERTLDRDLSDVTTQAKLHLALRLIDHTGGSPGREYKTLDAVLGTPRVLRWAQTLLAPLTPNESLLATLRAWMDNNTRLEATAAALGVSAPGARKRLARIGRMLGRSLLDGPSARYDLLIALRLCDHTAL